MDFRRIKCFIKGDSMNYRSEKTLVPYCDDCDNRIIGNGSLILPYKCKCGIWEYDEAQHDYVLKKDNEN